MWLFFSLILGCSTDPQQVFDELLAKAGQSAAEGRPMEALATLAEASKQAADRQDSEDQATALLSLGLLESELGRHDDAQLHLTDAATAAAPLPDGLIEGRALMAYADVLEKRGETSGVEASLIRACDRLDTSSGPKTAAQGCHERLGRHYAASGRWSEVLRQLDPLGAALRDDLTAEPERLVMVELDLARALRELGDLEGAAGHVAEATEAAELLAPEHGLRASVLAHRSELNRLAGRLPAAVQDLEAALVLAQGRFGKDDVGTALVWFNLGATRLEAMDFSGARDAFLEAKRIRSDKLGADHPEVKACDEGLAIADSGWRIQHDLDGVSEAPTQVPPPGPGTP